MSGRSSVALNVVVFSDSDSVLVLPSLRDVRWQATLAAGNWMNLSHRSLTDQWLLVSETKIGHTLRHRSAGPLSTCLILGGPALCLSIHSSLSFPLAAAPVRLRKRRTLKPSMAIARSHSLSVPLRRSRFPSELLEEKERGKFVHC